jgi:DNA-binding CsgD family transcriptional regulator
VFRKSWDELVSQSTLAVATRQYSVKAWDTQPRAKSVGMNPLTPREPVFMGRDIRLAARMVDIQTTRYYANPSIPLSAPRSIEAGGIDLGGLYERALAIGVDETERERSARLTGMASADAALKAHLEAGGIGGAFDLAELTHEERVVAGYVFDGKTRPDIVLATGKAQGTVDVLRARAMRKLRALAQTEEEVA